MSVRSPKDGKSESPKDGTFGKQLSYIRPKYVFSPKDGKVIKALMRKSAGLAFLHIGMSLNP
jgi:hypothetical protein